MISNKYKSYILYVSFIYIDSIYTDTYNKIQFIPKTVQYEAVKQENNPFILYLKGSVSP